jgi:uridine kinase
MNPTDLPVHLIGIAGGSASGKTMVARAIVEELGPDEAMVIEQDAYYRDLSHLPFDDRKRQNFDHPSAFDTDFMLEQLRVLLSGGFVDKPTYDYARHTRSDRTERVGDHAVIIRRELSC